ncbi:sporulation integral membrane protein YtvI [Neobacillus notoginsengisoli]|nr:sporulation integral membrane protein YtvI [Neobacillus notoginsengisoli]
MAWIIAAIIALYFILPVSVPLILALFTAILLEPAVIMVTDKFKAKRHISILTVFTLFVILIGSLGYYLTVKAAAEAVDMVNHVPAYVNKISSYWLEAKERISLMSKDMPENLVVQMTSQVDNFIISIKNVLLNYVSIGNIKSILTNVPNLFISFIVYLVALFLFMVDIPKLRKGIQAHLTEQTAEKVNNMFSRISTLIIGFIKAQFLVGVLIFIISLVGLFVITPDAALLAAALIWIFDFIPVIGPLIILGPMALFFALTNSILLSFELVLLAAILIAVRQYLEPKLHERHSRLSPLITLAAMYLGFKIIGVFGIIMGPIAVVALKTAREAGILKYTIKL